MRVEQGTDTSGITKRKEQELLDYFAGLAMQAYLTNEDARIALIIDSSKTSGAIVEDYIAADSYKMSKAMLKARKEGTKWIR